jgi:TonB family protein
MIARWMLASTVFGVLIALATLSLERLLRARARETRGLWSAALSVAVVWPVLAVLVLTQPSPSVEVTIGATVAIGTPTPVELPWWESWRVLSAAQIDAAALAIWAIASALLLLQALRAVRTLRRVEQEATRALIDGTPVLVSASIGPAVFGLIAPRVVVPSWLLSLDDALQAMVLRHEREHCTGRDAWLVWQAVVATTLMPWNAAVWFVASRLRLAMELDCDARTLRALPGREEAYARLLLLIAQRGARARFTPALAHVPSHLSRRIMAMTTRPRITWLQRTTALVTAASALALACSRPVAGNLAGPAAPEPTPVARAAVVPSTAPTAIPSDAPYFDFQVEKPAVIKPGTYGPAYPPALRASGKEGTVLTQFVVTASGAIDVNTFKVLKSDDPAFTEAVRAALPSMPYLPALVGGRAVKQLVQVPFAFRTNGKGVAVTIGQPPTDEARVDVGQPQLVPPRMDAEDSTRVRIRAAQREAALLPGFVGPVYPEALRAEAVEGRVLTMLVVNADGTPDLQSFKVLTSDHPLFTDAVKTALTAARFAPALVNGKPVRQLLQLPFEFKTPKQ